MIVIGDVHGNFDTLMALIAKFPKDQQIVLVGDLIDRGPKSKEVVEWVIANNIDCVAGNHEDMMSTWTGAMYWSDPWLSNGGAQTLESYGVMDAGSPIPQIFRDHQTWMADLPLMLAYPDVKNAEGRFLVVSHSSCGSVWHWTDERRQQQRQAFEGIVMWGRSPPKDAPEIYNIFGHTPQPLEPRIKVSFANVDTGCYWTKDAGQYGKLTGLQFPEMIVYSQENVDVRNPVYLKDDE